MADAVAHESASYRQLVWRRFRKSRLGMASAWTLAVLYSVALLAEFVAPFGAQHDDAFLRYVPPQHVHVFAEGRLHLPFVHGLTQTRDPETLAVTYSPDESTRYPVTLLHHGDPYLLAGLVPWDVHLFGSDGPVHLLGTDHRGRDLLSRIVFGARVSLTVGLLGVVIALVLGSILGAASAWYGGVFDTVLQRGIELLSSFPTIPLWMALTAALPASWSPFTIYAAVIVILSLLGWGGLARQVRGKILSVREADYVLAARAAGAGDWYLMRRHLLPTAYSHIIVTATLAIPGMILGETALSFLGLGIRPPLTSWGVLLEDAQRVTVLLHYPWLLFPAIPVLLTVIAFNLVGDALRDAADPYG